MNNILYTIKDICENHPLVNQVGEGEVFNVNSLKSIKYPLVWIDFDNTESNLNDFIFNFKLFYFDRILDDKSNEVEIQLDSVYVLNDILSIISSSYATYTNFNIIHFNQQVNDMCAGGYVTFRVEDCLKNGYTKDIEIPDINLLPSNYVSYNNDTLTSFLDSLSGITTEVYTDDTLIGDGGLNSPLSVNIEYIKPLILSGITTEVYTDDTLIGDGSELNPLSIYEKNFNKTINYNLDGTINNIVYDDGKMINYTYNIDGEIISWEDGYRKWTVIRDDGKIININIVKI